MRRALDGALAAVAFLTIVPVRLRRVVALGDAALWFPVVGGVVGAAAGGVRYGLDDPFGPGVASVLAVLALVVLTGALHQDGLADCADGLGARGGGFARRLEVMRDSATGTFGVLALLGWLLLCVTALAGLERGDAFCALVIAGAAGRAAAVLHAVLVAPARPDGLGAGFVVGLPAAAGAGALALAAALPLAGVGDGLVAAVAAALTAVVVALWAERMLGGRTGDTLGATVALAEAAVLVALLGLA